MSCAGKGYGTNPQSNDYLTSQFYSSIVSNNVSNSIRPKSTRNCRKATATNYPSFKPVLSNLSTTTSPSGGYSFVYVDGSNFLPNGTTFIKFGQYGYIPVTYYSSFRLSFVVPLNTVVNDYEVQVVNLYNDNFSPQINQTNPGNINLSTNSITYTIT
jgi:hypothetical protein